MNRKEMMDYINNALDEVPDDILSEVMWFLKIELGV